MVIEISAFNQKSSHGQQKLAARVLSDHTNGAERERNKRAKDTGDVENPTHVVLPFLQVSGGKQYFKRKHATVVHALLLRQPPSFFLNIPTPRLRVPSIF